MRRSLSPLSRTQSNTNLPIQHKKVEGVSIASHETDVQRFLNEASLLEAALAYASYRFHVFPCVPGDKQPATKQGFKDRSSNPSKIKDWWNGNPAYNIGIALRYSTLAVIDVDPRNSGDTTLEDLERRFGRLPPTFTVRTGSGGVHYYYRVPDDAWYDEHDIPKQLGPGLDFLTNGYAVAPPSTLSKSGVYLVEKGELIEGDFARVPTDWLLQVGHEKQLLRYTEAWDPEVEDWYVEPGERDNTMTAIAGWARAKGCNQEEIEAICRVLLPRFEDPNDVEKRIPTIARGMLRHAPNQIRFNDLRVLIKTRRHEPKLDDRVLHGPIGSWVKHVIPHSEMHPAALMAQALCAFGNIIGAVEPEAPAPGFNVGATRHTTGLYVMLIGDSARAGKGDSWAHVQRLMKYVDPTWEPLSGVQTGEGLIDLLADDEPNGIKLKDKTKGETTDGKWKGGQRDRRCFIYEPEFARTLHVSARQGSTLRDVYRDLWDRGGTKKNTAGSKQQVSGTTVSLVGHITKPELERDFDPVDLLSGFGNRFLHVYTKRTRTLPDEHPISNSALHKLGAPIRAALDFARDDAPESYEFTDDAYELWSEIVKDVSRMNPSPMVDALTARARPMIRRLAVIYAVLDQDDMIDVAHLEAAAALWNYCEETVEYVFGSYIGDRVADLIFRLLIEHPAGITMSDFYKANSNISKARWERGIHLLQERHLIQTRKEKRRRKTVDIYFVNRDAI